MTRTSLTLEQKWRDTLPELNEKQRRTYAAREAKVYGFGGVTAFARATGMNRDTINQGMKELEAGNTLQGDRIRLGRWWPEKAGGASTRLDGCR
jgi:hypothetical protein